MDCRKRGLNPYAAARELDIDHGKTYDVYVRSGHTVKWKLTEKQISILNDYFHSGRTPHSACKAAGCSHQTANRFFAQLGYTFDNLLTDDQKAELQIHFENGLTPGKSAKLVDCSYSAAHRVFEGLGYKPKSTFTSSIKGAYNDGLPPEEAALKIGCHLTTVQKIYKKLGYKSTTFESDARECYEAGLTVTEASKKIGCSGSTVLIYYKQFGYKPRGRSRLSIEDIDILKNLFNQGKNIKETSSLTNTSTQTVSKYFLQFGKIRKNMTEGEQHKIRDLLENGYKPSEIARIVGRRVHAVTYFCRKMGYNSKYFLSDEQKEQIPRLLADGVGPLKASKILSCSRSNLTKYYISLGWKPSRRGGSLTESEIDTIRDYYDRGYDIQVAVKETKLTRTTVTRYFHQFGWKEYLSNHVKNLEQQLIHSVASSMTEYAK